MPESGKLTSQEFSSALSRTLDQMQREATKASVALPPKDATGQPYSFSFAAQRERLAYAAGSLEPLSVQLGEVKAICSVLFQARVNSLDELRRERVSEDDLKGPQTDYLPEKSVTNELAVLAPYEVSFRCFSSELAARAGRLCQLALRPDGQVHQRRVGARGRSAHRAMLCAPAAGAPARSRSPATPASAGGGARSGGARPGRVWRALRPGGTAARSATCSAGRLYVPPPALPAPRPAGAACRWRWTRSN